MEIYAVLFFTGIVVGAMNAIAGGGGLVGFPVLIASGLPALVANATSFAVTLLGQVSSAFGYREYLKKLPKIYLLLVIPCAVGGWFGSEILKQTSFTTFDKIVPFLILLTVVIFAFQPLLNTHLVKHLRSHRKNTWALLLIGLALLLMSVYGGYFGVGLGFAVLAILGFMRIHEIHTLVAMKNLASVTVALVVIINLSGTDLISWHEGLTMGAGTLFGGYFGARMAQKVPGNWIRWTVIIIGLVSAAVLFALYY